MPFNGYRSLRAALQACALIFLAWPASRLLAQQPANPPNHQGFPLTIAGAGSSTTGENSMLPPDLVSQPVMADLGLTPGFNQIIFGTKRGDLYVLKHNSDGTWSPAPGWPQNVGAHIASSPAVGDLDGDGIPEIVVGYGSTYDPMHQGGAAAFKRDGTLMWTVVTGPLTDGPDSWTHAPVYGTPAIGDVDGDGKMEVVFGSFDHFIYVVDGATGNLKPGWPVDAFDTIFTSPALYDIDGDGLPDIIIGSDAHLSGPPANTPNGGCLRVLRFDGTYVAGFPKCIDQSFSSSPVVADIDGDGHPEIIHGTGSFYAAGTHQIYAWHCDGTPVAGWPVATDGNVIYSPAIANLDGQPEVIVTDDNKGPSGTFHVYAFRGNGTLLWKAQPVDFFGNTLSAGEPIVADVLGDSHLEVLIPTSNEIAVFSSTGTQLTQAGLPSGSQKVSFYTQTGLSGVFVGDLETDHADGKIEMLAVSGSPFPTPTDIQVFAWNPVSSDNAPPWGMFRHSIDRLGVAPGAGSCGNACVVDGTAKQFFTLPPCRVVDTRQTNGSYGSPALTSGSLRQFVMTGQCGIPSGAVALSVNVTVLNGTGAGNLRFSPGCAPPLSSTINWSAGQIRANNAVLSLDASGHLTVDPLVTGSGTVDLLIDVSGYFK